LSVLSLPGGDVALGPDERVIWSGQPRALPPLRAFRHYGHPAILALGALVAVFLSVGVVFLWATKGVKAPFFLVLLTLLVQASELVLAALARRSRRYVVTTSRAFVSDVVMTWVFPLRGSRIERDGDSLVFGGVEARACAHPVGLALALHAPMRAALSDLPDAGLTLAELEPIVREAPPAPPTQLDRTTAKRAGRRVFPIAAILVFGVFLATARLTRVVVLDVPVPAAVTGSATGLVTSVSAVYLGTFTPEQFRDAQRAITAGARSYSVPGVATGVYALTFTVANVSTQACLGGVTAGIQATLRGAPVSLSVQGVDGTSLPGETTTSKVLFESPAAIDAFSVTVSAAPETVFVAPWR
jgi:hypothetical protein